MIGPLGRDVPQRPRHGFALPVVLGLIILLALLVVNLSQVTQSEARLTRMLTLDAEHFYRAEAVVARIANRLKKRPWMVRWYAEGGYGSGPWSTELEGTYRDGAYRAWVQDVVPPEGDPVPGLVDVFVRMDLDGRVRRYHYRLGLLEHTPRRGRNLVTEYLGRVPQDLTAGVGRAQAAQAATSAMIAVAQERAAAEAALEALPPTLNAGFIGSSAGGETNAPGPIEALADGLLAGSDAAEVGRRVQVDRLVRTAIHLLGEDGGGFQTFLPPLERGRFVNRQANHSSARSRAQEAADQAPDDLAVRILTSLVIARSLTAEAWKRGPRSAEAQEILQRAWEALQAAADAYRDADVATRSRVDPTRIATVFIDQARVAVVAGWGRSRVDAAMSDAQQAVGGAGLYGGQQDLDTVLISVVDALETDEAQERIGSDLPLSPSGFAPVTEADVDGFVADAGRGWADWPEDSGRDEDFWDDLWQEEEDRVGEGGTGDPEPDIDRDGDGSVDEDVYIEPTDSDGTGITSSSAGPPPLVEQEIRADILACHADNVGIGNKRNCMRGVLEQAAASGVMDFHMHKEDLGGIEVHMKIKDGRVKNDDVKPKN